MMLEKWIVVRCSSGTSPRDFIFEGVKNDEYTAVVPGIFEGDRDTKNEYVRIRVPLSSKVTGVERKELPPFDLALLDLCDAADYGYPLTEVQISKDSSISQKQKDFLVSFNKLCTRFSLEKEGGLG